MPWPTPNVLGSPFDAKFGRWGEGPNWLYGPSQLPNLAAWYDAQHTATIQNGADETISDGELVKTWIDKSGNTGRNLANATEANRPYYYTKLADGLVFDGTAGATVANVPAFGTGAFTVSLLVNPTAIPAVYAALLGGSAAYGFQFGITGTGVIYARSAANDNVSAPSSAALVAGAANYIVYTRSGTTGTYYINGVAAGTATDAYDYTTAVNRIGNSIEDAYFLDGTIQRPLIYNRALSGAEVAALYAAGGVPVAADYNSASNTPIYSSDFSAGVDSWDNQNDLNTLTGNVDSIDGADNWMSLARATGTGRLDIARSVTLVTDKKYRYSVTIFNPAGSTIDGVSIGLNADAGSGVQSLPANTRTTVSYESTRTTGTIRINLYTGGNFSGNAEGQIVYIRDVTVTAIGLLLSPDTTQPAAGTKWYDLSGNAATITLPASGVTWSGVATKPGIWSDGDSRWLKSAATDINQPCTIYWVGQMQSWTASDYLFDGGATNSGALIQTTATPQVNLNAGSSVAGNTDGVVDAFGVFCAVFDGANSTLRWKRLTATTGDAGAADMDGITLFARGAADAGYFNGMIVEFAIYEEVHSVSTQNKWVSYAARRHGFSA